MGHKWQVPGQGEPKIRIKGQKTKKEEGGGGESEGGGGAGGGEENVRSHKHLRVRGMEREQGKPTPVPATNAANVKRGAGCKTNLCFSGVALILTFRNNVFCSPVMNILEKSLKP